MIDVVTLVVPDASPVLTAGTVSPAGGLQLPVPPEAEYPAAPVSCPSMKYWLELGRGENVAPGPSNPKAPPGGVKVKAATSYWPIRRLPWGVTARQNDK